jgi:hypothetical protein
MRMPVYGSGQGSKRIAGKAGRTPNGRGNCHHEHFPPINYACDSPVFSHSAKVRPCSQSRLLNVEHAGESAQRRVHNIVDRWTQAVGQQGPFNVVTHQA